MIRMFDVTLGEKKTPLYSSLCVWLSETKGTSHNTDEASGLKCWGQSVGVGDNKVTS